jgi:hypothetical protein
MAGKSRYKFKVINGVLSWKNDEMERYMPVSAEILTRVVMLYEKEFRRGIEIWKQVENNEIQGNPVNGEDPLFEQLSNWMEQLQGIFSNTEPYRERWTDDFQLN